MLHAHGPPGCSHKAVLFIIVISEGALSSAFKRRKIGLIIRVIAVLCSSYSEVIF